MRTFRYVGLGLLGVLITQMGGVISITISTLFGLGLIVLRFSTQTDASTATILCIAIWFLGIGWVVGLILLNINPIIWLKDDGLEISVFMLGRVSVPWNEIVELKPRWTLFGDYLVLARKITPIHLLIGWTYSGKLLPGFVISRGMQGRDEILREIRERIKA